MIAVFVLILGPPVLEYGFRLVFHAVDPSKYGPAGIPSAFQDLMSPSAELGFIIAVTVGAAAGTTDLTDGMFRHLVITGRSCPEPDCRSVNHGVSIPVNLSESQFHTWIGEHPREALQAFPRGPGAFVDGVSVASGSTASRYDAYTELERILNPSVNEMVKIGLWLGLVVGVGFVVGLGFGALTGQRTVTTIVLIALEIIVTPIFDRAHIPYFINGQRLLVGVALDQLRPAGLTSGAGGGAGGWAAALRRQRRGARDSGDANLGNDPRHRGVDRRLVGDRCLEDGGARRVSGFAAELAVPAAPEIGVSHPVLEVQQEGSRVLAVQVVDAREPAPGHPRAAGDSISYQTAPPATSLRTEESVSSRPDSSVARKQVHSRRGICGRGAQDATASLLLTFCS